MSDQATEMKVVFKSFPLLSVYALNSTVFYYLTHRVEDIIGKDGTLGLRTHLYTTIVSPAEYELLAPLEKFELSRHLLRDDGVFTHYIPDECYPTFTFPQAAIAITTLKKAARALGVPRKLLSKEYQSQMHLQLTFEHLASYGGIDPGIDTDNWTGVEWLTFISQHEIEPRRSLILHAMAAMAAMHTGQEMGARLASVVGAPISNRVEIIDVVHDEHIGEEDDDEGIVPE